MDTVQADAARAHAVVKLQPRTNAAYTVRELTTPAGTVIRQYVSSSGMVFGVAWSGPYMPNLHQLLGSSYATLSQHEAKAGFAKHAGLQINEDGLFVETHGHMHDFAGRAYLPRDFPAGVSPAAIR